MIFVSETGDADEECGYVAESDEAACALFLGECLRTEPTELPSVLHVRSAGDSVVRIYDLTLSLRGTP